MKRTAVIPTPRPTVRRNPGARSRTVAKVAERYAARKISMIPAALHDVALTVSEKLDELHIPHAIGGGLALAHHGHNRATADVDFVISKSHQDKIEKTYGPTKPISGFLKGVTAIVDEVQIDFLFAAGKVVTNADLAKPEKDAGLPYVNLTSLVAMKVGAARMKDSADIVELLKLGKVHVEDVSKRLTSRALEEKRENFNGLVLIAKLEQQGNAKKGQSLLVARMLRTARGAALTSSK